ncbi:hypothetical protein [Glycomyces sp. NPDC047010]|uniref:hypothetical protein n=1 Tax=Glycomyces sp. NPDC047010 TaxID=3155023 RepID=UPI0033F81889
MERRDASAGRRAAALAIGAAALALALTGCGAGQHAETSKMQTAISGVDADAGSVALRDVQIDFGDAGNYREGGQAPLRVWMANNGDEAVSLVAVTSPVAEAVTLATEVVEVEESPAEESPSAEATTPGESASPGEDASGSPSADASPDAEETVAELVGEREFAIELAPSDYARLAPSTGSFLLLEGLKEDVTMGTRVEVAFTFSNGETVVLDVPMGIPDVPQERTYFGDPHEPAAE